MLDLIRQSKDGSVNVDELDYELHHKIYGDITVPEMAHKLDDGFGIKGYKFNSKILHNFHNKSFKVPGAKRDFKLYHKDAETNPSP